MKLIKLERWLLPMVYIPALIAIISGIGLLNTPNASTMLKAVFTSASVITVFPGLVLLELNMDIACEKRLFKRMRVCKIRANNE